MKQIQRIGIVGAGALGILYGQQLTQAFGQEHVFFIADFDRIQRYQQTGFTCNGVPCHFRFVAPEQATTADLIIYAVKYTALQQAIELTRPFVHSETILLSLLNGIVSEQDLSKAFGKEHLLYCVAQGMDAVKEKNALTFRNAGVLLIGCEPENQDKLNAVADLFCQAHIPYQLPDDIFYALWNKLMLNTGVNQCAAAYETDYSGLQREGEARQVMLAAMKEVQQIAHCEGVQIKDEEFEKWMELLATMNPSGMPSMRQDTKAHRPTEVELFSGTIRRLGQKHGISTPANDFLYDKITEMEKAYLAR